MSQFGRRAPAAAPGGEIVGGARSARAGSGTRGGALDTLLGARREGTAPAPRRRTEPHAVIWAHPLQRRAAETVVTSQSTFLLTSCWARMCTSQNDIVRALLVIVLQCCLSGDFGRAASGGV